MPYVEAKSQTVKNIFRTKRTIRLARAKDMVADRIYLFSYDGKQNTTRRPLLACFGIKKTKTGKLIIEGANLNYLTEVQGKVFDGFEPVWGSVPTQAIMEDIAKAGDYKKFPLETVYRTYSIEKISNIEQIVMES